MGPQSPPGWDALLHTHVHMHTHTFVALRFGSFLKIYWPSRNYHRYSCEWTFGLHSAHMLLFRAVKPFFLKGVQRTPAFPYTDILRKHPHSASHAQLLIFPTGHGLYIYVRDWHLDGSSIQSHLGPKVALWVWIQEYSRKFFIGSPQSGWQQSTQTREKPAFRTRFIVRCRNVQW